jgi:hypothetical protein
MRIFLGDPPPTAVVTLKFPEPNKHIDCNLLHPYDEFN